MRKFCLVFLVGKNADVATLFEAALRRLGVDVELISVPYFLLSSLTVRRLADLENLIKEKAKERFVIFCPDSTELFLRSAQLLVGFSAYRSWYDEDRMRIIPHLWTPVGSPPSIDHLRWRAKPPLKIGFMGRMHDTSRLVKVALGVPTWAKQILLRGRFLNHPTVTAALTGFGLSLANLNAFVRAETITALKSAARKSDSIDFDVIERKSFSGSEIELKEYKDHLAQNTYIVCPRGSENYSYRMYEALTFGRIPVIIDTDVVLPKEIDWNAVSVIVPYKNLDKVSEIIREDYESCSQSQFLSRQEEALSTMKELRTMRWIDQVLNEVVKRANS